MKVIIIFVSTIDGKITKWGHPVVRSWSSPDDQQYFSGLLKSSKLVVLGSNTYNTEPFPPAPGQELIVMTSHPEKFNNHRFADVHFTSEEPAKIILRYKNMGFEEMLMVGGPRLATSFLKDQLIDEIWLTVEPKIFGSGGNFVSESLLDISLQLLSCEKLNQKGTLLLKYQVTSNLI